MPSPPTSLMIRPNASLSVRQALWIWLGVCAVSMLIAGGLALLGFWMVLPFAGLEMACLGAAFWVALRDNGYREVIRVDGDQLAVERGRGRPESRWECPLAWAQVEAAPARWATDHPRILLRCSGRRTEVGKLLSSEEKAHFDAKLRAWLQAAQRASLRPDATPHTLVES